MLPKDKKKIKNYRKKLSLSNKGNKSWKFRKKHGHIKGEYKCSNQTKEKISKANRGISRNKGDLNPAKRKEVREKISKTLKQKYKNGIIKSIFQNKEILDKIKMRNSIRMKNGGAIKALRAVKKRGTYIENLMEEILKDLNLDYKQQYKIKNYLCDFYIPKYNLVIECDGEHWHNYPNYNKRDIQRDIIMMKLGYFILRFWSREIKQKNKCSYFILDTIQQIKKDNCICKEIL